MNISHTNRHNTYADAAKKIVARIGKTITIGVPLGLGKPIGILNALYSLAAADNSIQLTIITGLTLARPVLHSELEKRFVEPILDRILKNYADPLYEIAREQQQLPENIQVIEFFLTPGKYLHNQYVQQNYISSKYTNVIRDSLSYAINVFAQQVAHSTVDFDEYSLSCNTDLFHLTTQQLKTQGPNIAIIAEVNQHLPFMVGNDAVVGVSEFTDIIDAGEYKTLFSIPREELSAQDHLIGLYTSCLIKDAGCLQIGIGKLNNAVANALIFRHKENDLYLAVMQRLSINKKFGKTLSLAGSMNTFEKGLYASTEMFSDEYMELYKENILKKRVYDNIELQKLLNSNEIDETITPELIDVLLKNKIINPQLNLSDVEFLLEFGIFHEDIYLEADQLILASGEKITADLSLPKSKQKIIDQCLGHTLKSGKIVHAGFILGSAELYKQLHALPIEVRKQISMTSIARTNALTWFPELLQLQRQHARFVNSAMMITLGGAVISDGLMNLQEVSGVGGQFDFVEMASNLENARSIINCRSTRETKEGIKSNILWEYPNQTIPRYLRDIVVTEYGIADCRSKTDSEVIQSILNITDSRFQEQLLSTAKKYGKLSRDYQIPACFKQNYPHIIVPVIRELQAKGYCQPYPFGSDLTEDEQVIQRVLLLLNNCSRLKLAALICRSIFFFGKNIQVDNYLIRMKINSPGNLKDFLYKKLFTYIIHLSLV